MIYNDREIRERRITATVTEAEILDAVKRLVFEKAKLTPAPGLPCRVYITTKDRVGTSGIEYEAKVELAVPLDALPEPAA